MKRFFFLKYTAIISGLFSAVIILILTINYVQLKKVDPAQNMVVNKLIEKLEQNPSDQELKEQIRTIDLVSRKAFFTNRWQMKTGGYLLLFTCLVFLVSLKYYLADKKSISPPSSDRNENFWESRSKQKVWLISAPLLSLTLILVLIYISNKAYLQADLAAIPEAKEINPTDSTLVPTPADTATAIPNIQADSVIQKAIPDQKNIPVAEKKSFIPPTKKQIQKNWPSFRGPYSQGISYGTNFPIEWGNDKNLKWKVKLELPGFNSPIVWGNYLFVSGANKQSMKVYCYHALTGKLLWEKLIENIPGSPAIKPKVTEDTGLAAPGLASNGIHVFAIFATGDLVCLDFEGNQLWAKNLGVPANHYGHSSSLICWENLVLVQYDHSKSRTLFAFKAENGEIVWQANRGGLISWSSPIIVHDQNPPQILLNNDPNLAAYDLSNGKELWKLDCLSGEIGASPAYFGGIAIATNAYSKMTAVKLSAPVEMVWEGYDYLPDASSPVAWNNMVFTASSAGEVACFNLADGKELWLHEFDYGFYASPIVAERKVFFLDRMGTMHIVKASSSFELIAQPSINEKTDCTPAFANGCIYIKSKENLFCFSK